MSSSKLSSAVVDSAEVELTDEPTCAVCPHPADAHDAIGVRFCAATQSHAFERGCVCVGGAGKK